MLFPDVNVLVGAQRNDDSPHARTMRTWLEGALAGHEPVGVSELVLSGMIRIVTHPRVFAQPSTPSQALAFVDALIASPAVRVVRPAVRHWEIFAALVGDLRLRGNDVSDAYLASLATEQGATVVTADRGFGRFAVKVLDPTR
ncbi:MAG: PIN domain-containing protein [Nocardioides sp.]|uniref:TA system VapC family ribonuclease toxin n=1 Tax=Nocardioides sp. TaxID=35761 RepID=UPI0039E385C4